MPQAISSPLLLPLQNPLKTVFHHGHDPEERNKVVNGHNNWSSQNQLFCKRWFEFEKDAVLE